ncbi:MAG: right-handed parallel beta-helix repeat-containing protein [Planctomycetota bacterium]
MPRPLDAVDARWLDAALHEVVGGAAPPVVPRELWQCAAEQRSAAQRLDVAAATRSRRPLLTAAVLLLGAAVVFGVFALRRGGGDGHEAAAQDPAAELRVADPAALAAFARAASTCTLVARSGERGERLADAPEHAGLLDHQHFVVPLREALGAVAATTAALGANVAQADLLLHRDVAAGGGYVRCRLHFDGDHVWLGTAGFALGEALAPELGKALRAEWLRLAAATPPQRQRLQARSLRELVAAIGSHRTIELIGGPFELDDHDGDGVLPDNPAVEWRDPSPTPYLVVKDVEDLQLRSIGGPVRLLGRSPADVLRLENCRGVQFEGLVMGHLDELAFACSAPVVTLHECRDVVLRDCELFGCGTHGIVADKVQGLHMERGEIHTCRYGVVQFTDARDLAFHGVRFRDCDAWEAGFLFRGCERVAFHDCVVTGMDCHEHAAGDALFGIVMDEPVRFVRGSIRGNRVQRLATSKLLLVREGTDEADNRADFELERAGDRRGR